MSKKLKKRLKKIKSEIDLKKTYEIDYAIDLLKKTSKIKFIESIDVAINLGIDPRKSEQNIRGSIILPHSIGKNFSVAVFAQGDNKEKAKKAGADVVGMHSLYNTIKNNQINFDVIIASIDTMSLVSKLGQFLGPKGLMPNPKDGTVTDEIYTTVKNAKTGKKIKYKNDKNGIIHTIIGKINLETIQIKENFECLIKTIKNIKPHSCKKTYLKKIFLSTTMGPGLLINHSNFDSI